jgi:hypothetical protein
MSNYHTATIAGVAVEVETATNAIVFAQDGAVCYDGFEGRTYEKCCAPCIAAYGPFAGDPRGHCPCDHCNPHLRPHYPNWPDWR